MAVEDVGQIRNIGMVGQGGGGKTSLADAMLFVGGANTRQGRVDDGTSMFDTEPEEIRRKLSLTTAFHHVTWKKREITILDMPGYANFLADSLNCMRVCSGLVFVLEAAPGGVKVEAEKLWERAEKDKVPRIGFVTKMDRENADFDAALKDVRELLQGKPVPLQLPIGAADTFKGVVDLLKMKALVAQPDGSAKEQDIPPDLAAEAQAAREQLIESVAEVDDALLEKYLDAGTLEQDEVLQALREGTVRCRFMPVLCGSGGKCIGVGALLDTIAELMPSPADLPPAVGNDPKSGDVVERPPSASAPFSAFVFKSVVDPFAGKLEILQVMSGQLTSDATVVNVNKDGRERIGHILKLEGKKQAQVQKAIAGEIVAVPKLKETHAGHTLADEKAPIRYPGPIEFPSAISFAMVPKSKGDEEKATLSLHKLCEEDPTLHVQRDTQTKEIIISGVGQLHIEVAIEKLKRKYGVEVELQAPKVPYKETIKGKAESQGKLKKQSGGRGQYGDCWLRIEPLPRGGGFEFVDDIVGGVIPRQYIPAVEKGVRDAMHGGVISGFEMVDVRVSVYDGSYHDVDSSEMAFKIAGSLGFKNAVAKAKPILLEPVMNMQVQVPDEFMGDVIGDLNSRRGKVLGVDPKPNGQVIRSHVPLSEVLRYAPDLRSMTSGRGTFDIAFSHYEEVPPHLAEKIIKESGFKKDAEE